MHLFTSEATGDREKMMRLQWPEHSEIHSVEIREVVWLKPELEYQTLADHGPLQPGEVSERAPDGTELVLVSASKRWKKQERMVQQATRSQKRGDDADVVGKETFGNVWDSVQKDLQGFSGQSSNVAPTVSSAVGASSASAGSSVSCIIVMVWDVCYVMSELWISFDNI